ncbi:serine protease [Lentzea sp. NPDC092896]|uniref:S1 family peptidase n=1 Tax=Lentzea sp. NPDC092896 TaxID=3364127 RepID=UPI0038174F3C
MPGDERIPLYLGRILTGAGAPMGTCFQVAPGVLVTAWHVLRDLRAGEVGSYVDVDALAGGDHPVLRAEVVAVDERRDLAVLRRETPLPGTIEAVSLTDAVAPDTKVVVTGVAKVEDPGHEYGFLTTTGVWRGELTRNDVPKSYFTSDSAALGMSGGPVRRAADDAVVGVVSARYNSDRWLQFAVWTARMEDVLALLPVGHRVKVVGQPKARVSRKVAVLLTVAALLLTVSATAGVVQLARQPVITATSAPPTTAPVAVHKGVQPMPADSPAVAVVGTERVQRRSSGASAFTVPAKIDMNDSQLAKFTTEVVEKTEGQATWYDRNGGVPIGFGLTKVTLMNKDSAAVRITDIEVLKECATPIAGTFFSGFTQGGPSGVVQLGFDLDEPSPTVQQMALQDVPKLIGESYFTDKSIELRPGDQQDLVLAALTTNRHCKFRLRLIIATAAGSYSLDVDDNGKPFEVSGKAAPTVQGAPFSAYQAAYLRNYDTWSRIDPRTYRP